MHFVTAFRVGIVVVGEMVEIPFGRVVEIWQRADSQAGRDTSGILFAFRPAVTRWLEGEIAARDVNALRFIGGVPGDRYEQLTRGSYKVGDAAGVEGSQEAFRWEGDWRIIVLTDPENRERVVIDGNGRVLALVEAVRGGAFSGDERIGIIVGELWQPIVFIAKAIAPLWR